MAMTRGAGGARSLLVNISSVVGARAWAALLQFFAAPFYIMLLGADAYGLVLFNLTLLGALSFLENLMSPVLVRQLGRHAADDPAGCRNMLRSFEFIAVIIALMIGLVIGLGAPYVAAYWLKSDHLTEEEIARAVMLIGVSLACQWPGLLYSAGFVGLHRQDLFGAVRAVMATLVVAGGLLLLWLVAPRVELLLAWQAAGFLVQSLVFNRLLWRIMPSSPAPVRFDHAIVMSLWRFATGVMLINLTGSLLTQADKLIVSKTSTLNQFSAYGLAFFVVSSVCFLVMHSITGALLPHFSRLWDLHDEAVLGAQYHRWTQFIVATMVPALGLLIFFPIPLLQLWLGTNSPLVAPVAVLLPWVAFGAIFSVAASMAQLLQLAAGRVRLLLARNIVSLALVLPSVYLGTRWYGPVAGAICWAIMNVGIFVIEIPILHRRVLRGELWSWWMRDTLVPFAVAGVLFFALARHLPEARWPGLAYIALAGALVFAALVVLLPHARAEILVRWRQLAGFMGWMRADA